MLILCDMNNVLLVYLMLSDYVYYNLTFINHERSNYLQTQNFVIFDRNVPVRD